MTGGKSGQKSTNYCEFLPTWCCNLFLSGDWASGLSASTIIIIVVVVVNVPLLKPFKLKKNKSYIRAVKRQL